MNKELKETLSLFRIIKIRPDIPRPQSAIDADLKEARQDGRYVRRWSPQPFTPRRKNGSNAKDKETP